MYNKRKHRDCYHVMESVTEGCMHVCKSVCAEKGSMSIGFRKQMLF